MSRPDFIPAGKLADLGRRLARYTGTYPDSDFLDSAHAAAQAGNPFTRDYAAMVEDALRNWERRLNSPSYDPDRSPPGYDPHVWQLATCYRGAMEDRGWSCPSRRLIYAEITRVITRDKFRENYSPWRDKPGEPGWYRMMRDVIAVFADEYTAASAAASWYAHEQLARPGEIARITGYLTDQAKTARLDALARPASMSPPAPERRAAVKAWIAARKHQQG